MPYNTRRKSLSLPSLGIHVPITHAARAAAKSATPPSDSTPATPSTELPPTKKMKRSHGSLTPPREISEAKQPIKYEHTPPPSPEAETEDGVRKEIDLEGINDEIVEGVIVQLQKTGNRPHLVKELAAILSRSVKIVETSANPSAIISSRLSTYLKRPCWNAVAPCPLAKELETVHPRRTYFYLTTYPHQPIPDTTATSNFPQRSIISPSLSSAPSRSDSAELRRRELSPSPEVDLSPPEELDDDLSDDSLVVPLTPTGSFSKRMLGSPKDLLARNSRATSPPLEKDEKEFTQTARGMQIQRRKLSADYDRKSNTVHEVPSAGNERGFEFTESLFGRFGGEGMMGSPVVKVERGPLAVLGKRGFEDCEWDVDADWDMRSPEQVGIEELDGLLDDF